MISQIVWNHPIRLMLTLFALGTLCSHVAAAENSWPKILEFDHGVIQLYQPEIARFEGNNIEALAAVAIKTNSPGPVFAAISFSAISDSAPTALMVTIHDIELTGVHFGEGVDQYPNGLVAALEQELGRLTLTIEQLPMLAESGAESQISGQGVKSEPINILFRTTPSVLVALDGDPRLQPIENSDLAWVANSTFPMLHQRGTYYLLIGSKSGYRSTSPQGPWTQVTQLPANIRNLFDQAGTETSDPEVIKYANPDIIVTTEPTALLVSEGIPAWAPLAGMQLLYMTNTDSDIFLDLQSGRHYVLLQGRWYTGLLDNTGDSWMPAGNDELPAPFADIDVLSPKSHVLAFVNGTPQARSALLDNKLPQGKAVPRNDTSFDAEWDGEPVFESVAQNAGLEYAINTPDSVFRVGDRYYACEDGVWFESTSAFGPWWVATEVPDIIYAIPASNPQHRVTYARIYDVTPEVVYVGYTPGYMNYYGYHGSVVFGSGWRYQPWYGSHYYSHHSSHHWGWNYQSRYDPWFAWGFVNAVHRPHYYTHNRHHYRNTWRNQKKHQRRTAKRRHDSRNDSWRYYANHNPTRNKTGRHRVNEDRNAHQATVSDRDRRVNRDSRDRSRDSYSKARSSYRNDTAKNRTNKEDRARSTRTRTDALPAQRSNRARSNRIRTDASVAQRSNNARSTRIRTDAAVAKSRNNARRASTRTNASVAQRSNRVAIAQAANPVQRGQHRTSNLPQKQASRPNRVRSEHSRTATSPRREPVVDTSVTRASTSSRQQRGRSPSARRVPDQTHRATAQASRPAAKQSVAMYSSKDRASKPAAAAKPQQQRSARASQRSNDRRGASRNARASARKHR